jgi:hypothetical protein
MIISSKKLILHAPAKILVGMLMLVCFAGKMHAQISMYKAGFEKDTMLIGDQVNFSFTAFYKGGEVFFPILKDSLGSFEIIAQNTPVYKDSNGMKYYEVSYKLTQFNPGRFAFEPIMVLFKQREQVDTLYTPSCGIYVKSIKLDSTDVIKPIKGPIQIPFSWKEWLPYIIGGLILLALVGLFIFWLITRRDKGKPMATKITPLEAHEVALKKLKILDQTKRWQSDEIKLYYLELSEIIREYLENRYQFPAKESTSGEIMDSLAQLRLKENVRKELSELLTISDLAKFAKMKPLPDENLRCLKQAVEFVKATKPSASEIEQQKDKDE